MQAAANKHSKQLKYDNQRKQSVTYQAQRRSARHSASDSVDQHHYGNAAQQPDVSPTELNTLCNEYFQREIAVNSAEAERIERETRGQCDSGIWYHHRRIRLTASNFGIVAKRRKTTPVANTVKNLLYTRNIDTKAIRWGRTHEDDARFEYLQFLRSCQGCEAATVTNSGLVIDQHEVCLACSPDGLVCIPGTHEPDGLIEIKCPFLAAEKQLTPQEAADVLSSFPCRRSSDAGGLELNRKHNYFYQVQGQLAITRRPWCDSEGNVGRTHQVRPQVLGRHQIQASSLSSRSNTPRTRSRFLDTQLDSPSGSHSRRLS